MPVKSAVILAFTAFSLSCVLIVSAAAPAQSQASDKKSGPKPHRAALNWKPSQDAHKPGVHLKYVIYRSDGKRNAKGAPECDGKFQRIGEVNASTTSYVDSTVKAERIYCYRVTTLIDKKESPASETVIAIIPPDKKE